ncbi:MAG TPA: hypothetical protein VFO01_13285 [Trebonia sp.]|nr:hypothetical protein [Trebonia sp.]
MAGPPNLAANGLLALISHALHMDTSASSVMLLMGMAVGVDYCLFYLRRERVGLSVSVLLDATLVRGVLLPSVMALLGDHNWYLPRRLARASARPSPGG